MIEQLPELVTPWSLAGAAASVAGIAAATVLVMRGRSRAHTLGASEATQESDGQRRRKVSAGTIAAAVAFVICTSVSLNTGYRFTADGLGMTATYERVLACAGFEALIAMCVLGARERLNSTAATPGWYGSAVWAFAALSSVPAYHEGGGFTTSTIVRIIIGSFGSALSAHAALGLELRHRTRGQQESQSPGALIVRELRERLMARLGLIERGRDAEQITKDRFLSRAVELADRYDRLTEEERNKRRGRKLCGRLAQALDRAGCSDDEAQKVRFYRRLAMRRDATNLPSVKLASTWQAQPTPEEADAAAQVVRQIEGLEQLAAQIEEHTAHGQAGPEGDGTPSGTGSAQQGADEEDHDHEHQDDEDDWDEPTALDLSKFPTKVAALRALFDRCKVAADDGRSTNQIATELLETMRSQGIEYDRGAACRAIGDWRNPHVLVPAQQQAQPDTLDRELAHA